MFQILNKTLKKNFMILMIFSNVVLGFTALYISSRNMYQQYVNLIDQEVNLSGVNASLYMNSVAQSAMNFISNESLLTHVESDEYHFYPNTSLNQLKDRTNSLGVALYTKNPLNIKRTSNIGEFGFLSLTDLMNDPDIRTFIEGDDESYTSFRTTEINHSYGNENYPKSNGIISFLLKIPTNDYIGLLVVDISPEVFLLNFKYESLENTNNYIKTNEDIYFKAPLRNDDQGFIISSLTYNYYLNLSHDATLIVSISLMPVIIHIIILFLSILTIQIIFLFLTFYLSSRVADGITTRLDKLSARMKKNPL